MSLSLDSWRHKQDWKRYDRGAIGDFRFAITSGLGVKLMFFFLDSLRYKQDRKRYDRGALGDFRFAITLGLGPS